MSLDYKPFDDLVSDDLLRLRENKVAEGLRYEYKVTLPGGSDSETRECLYDFSSLANATGGFLLYGVEETDRLPSQFPGVDAGAVDEHVHRVEHVLRDCVKPRISGVRHRLISVAADSPVLVWSIPRSLAAPHMVEHGKVVRFYTRNTVGKCPMDVDQIRGAFLKSATLAERLRAFRLERLSKLQREGVPLAVLHVIPEGFLAPGGTVDLSRATHLQLLRISQSGIDANQLTHNFDGVALADHNGQVQLQIFRDGTIEVLIEGVFWETAHNDRTIECLSASALEQAVIRILDDCLRLQDCMGAPRPTWLFLSVLNAHNRTIADSANQLFFRAGGKPIDRGELLFPEVLLEDSSQQLSVVLRPLFDQLWNSGGYSHSRSYDADGNWNPK